MTRCLLLLFLSLILNANASAQVWATAISENKSQGTAIIYRYIAEFNKNFERSTQPDRVIILWRYVGEKGMPSLEERVRMDELEDALGALEEPNGLFTLALVSTGDNLKEWTYYTRAEEDFFVHLNTVLRHKDRFPIEIHAAPDPSWTTYENFASGVRK